MIFFAVFMPNALAERRCWAELNLDYLIDFMPGDRYPLPRWQRLDAEVCAKLYENFYG